MRTWPNSFMRRLSILAVFSAFGPIVGYLTFWGLGSGHYLFSVHFMVYLAILSQGRILIYAYILGLPPALLAAGAALVSLRARRVEAYFAAATLVGALASPLWLLVVLGGPAHWPADYLKFAATGAIAGAVSALVAAPLARFKLRLPRIPRFLSRLHAGDVLLVVIGLLSVWIVATMLVPSARGQ